MQVEKLLEGWARRDKAPLFPEPQLKEARNRLHHPLQQRRETMASRIAGKFVQTAQGTGPDSYLPLNIQSMYGSFLPKLPSESTQTASAATLVRPSSISSPPPTPCCNQLA